ncbi:MAG: hypothetical protein ACI81L_003684 [Verrucomicrobiales bacterium]
MEGPGTAFHNGPTYAVESERIWAAGDVDPRWRELGHQAGLEGGDAGLNDFRPKYFHLTGKFQPMRRGKTNKNKVISDKAVATEGEVGGEPILIRWVNASYTRQSIWFDGIDDGSLEVDVIASDGRGFDNVAPNFAKPFRMTKPLETGSSERYDLLIRPLRTGTSAATISYLDWITGEELGVVRSTITGV